MRTLLLLMTIVLTTSCGLTSRYSDGQHDVYAKALTAEDKVEITERGQITKKVKFGDANDNILLEGELNVMKTKTEDVYDFVEIGLWINHSRIGNAGKDHNRNLRDTTLYDNLGNILSRRLYYENETHGFLIGEKWTSKQTEDRFIRHIEIFEDGKLMSEFDVRIYDTHIVKSDRQKKGVIVGTRKDYSKAGQLVSVKTYDENGKLIKEERYGR